MSCARLVGLVLVDAQPLDALLDLAHAGQVLVELGLVARADLAAAASSARSFTRSRMLLLRRLPRFSNRLSNASDGYTSFGTGDVGALPGDVRAVGHREVRLVVAGHRLLAAQHHARLQRLLADVVGEHLVHADAAVEIGALLERHAGEEVAGLARVDADADAAC